MHTKEVGKIENFLMDRVGETKGLGEWCQEINGQRLIRRKLTGKELAFIINRHMKNGPFQIEHRTNPIQYTFLKVDV